MTTVIQKWGNSQGIRLPKFLLDNLQWSECEQIKISTENDKLIIEKVKPRKKIEALFENYHGEYTPSEIDWGESAGKEVW